MSLGEQLTSEVGKLPHETRGAADLKIALFDFTRLGKQPLSWCRRISWIRRHQFFRPGLYADQWCAKKFQFRDQLSAARSSKIATLLNHVPTLMQS